MCVQARVFKGPTEINACFLNSFSLSVSPSFYGRLLSLCFHLDHRSVRLHLQCV